MCLLDVVCLETRNRFLDVSHAKFARAFTRKAKQCKYFVARRLEELTQVARMPILETAVDCLTL